MEVGYFFLPKQIIFFKFRLSSPPLFVDWNRYLLLGDWWITYSSISYGPNLWSPLPKIKFCPMDWHYLIWIKKGIPTHNTFICWLFHLNRFPTKDHIITWGIPTELCCILWQTCHETRDHLLYDCSFSAQLWNRICYRCGVLNVPS